MRVIYKYAGTQPPTPPPPLEGSGRRESVLVVSSEKKEDAPPRGGISLSGEGYEVRISREALDRNGEVRRHEKAHMAVLGSAATSAIIYDKVRGPAGEAIAVGGRIGVDLSEVPGDPAATISKARRIIAAANAAASPSAGDMKTAARAYRLAARAQEQLNGEMLQKKIDILG